METDDVRSLLISRLLEATEGIPGREAPFSAWIDGIDCDRAIAAARALIRDGLVETNLGTPRLVWLALKDHSGDDRPADHQAQHGDVFIQVGGNGSIQGRNVFVQQSDPRVAALIEALLKRPIDLGVVKDEARPTHVRLERLKRVAKSLHIAGEITQGVLEAVVGGIIAKGLGF